MCVCVSLSMLLSLTHTRDKTERDGRSELLNLFAKLPRKVDVRLPGRGNSNSHGARPVHSIITMIRWFWTNSRLRAPPFSQRA